jgi:hypothetical protein
MDDSKDAKRKALKGATSSAYVRAAAGSAVLVPLAALLGGMNLGNHNETVVRLMPEGRESEKGRERLKFPARSAYVRAVAASAVLAAFVGGVPLKNHNETIVRLR